MGTSLGLLMVGGLFGISLKKVFSHPFGSHSLFGKATQIASILPIPGAGLIGKAFGLMNRGRRAVDALQARVAPLMTAFGAARLVPSQALRGLMPGGTRTAPTYTRRPTASRSIGVRRRRVVRRTTKRKRRR